MKAVSPVIPGMEEHEVKVAEYQDEYLTLPALVCDNGKCLLSAWELTDEELAEVVRSKRIYLWVWTFGRPLQPISITAGQTRWVIEKNNGDKMIPTDDKLQEESDQLKVQLANKEGQVIIVAMIVAASVPTYIFYDDILYALPVPERGRPQSDIHVEVDVHYLNGDDIIEKS